MNNYLSIFARIIFLVIFLTISLFSQTEQKPEQKKPLPLEFGQIIEGEIGGIYTVNLFTVNLSDGQYVRIEAEQNGCDVIFSLFSDEGLNVFDVDNVSPDKVEFASAAVKKSGEYKLKVMSVAENKGIYKLRIAELRAATDKEINFTDGVILLNDAFNKSSSGATTEEIYQNISKYESALEKFRLAGDKSFESRTNNEIGARYMRLGNAKKAFEYYEKAISIANLIQDKQEIALNLGSLGAAYQTIGEWQKAFDSFSKALTIRRETKHIRGEAMSLFRIGNLFLNSGDELRALDYFQEALILIRRDTMAGNFEADILESIGKVNLAQKEYQKALESFQKALDLAKIGKSKRRETAILSNLGKTDFLLGNNARSIGNLNESLKISRELKDKIGEAATLKIIGQIHLANNETDKAIEFFSQSLEISRSLENTQILADTLLNSAKADAQNQNYEMAQRKIEEAIELIEKVRSRVQTTDLRDAFSANLQSFYGFYIELLMQRHSLDPGKNFSEKAFLANERARARGLLSLLNESNINIREGIEPKLLEKETETRSLLSARLENLTRSSGGKATPEQIQKLKTEIEQIRSDYEQIRSQIRQSSPRYSELTQPKILTLEEIRRDVSDIDSLLLEYHLGEKKSFLWIVSAGSFQTIELPAKAEIEQSARLFYNALTARNKRIKFETSDEKRIRIEQADEEILDNSANLSRILIEPAQKYLVNKRLMIVADGSLQYVPFAALQTNRVEPQFLVETNEIVYLPSASVLSILRRETNGRKSAPKTLAVLADPVFEAEDERYKLSLLKHKSKPTANKLFNQVSFTKNQFKDLRDSVLEEGFNLTRLPFTRREADAISAFVPLSQQTKMLDFNATKLSVVSPEIRNYRYIHFATHSFINDKSPELSGIVFSLFDETGKEQDGFLRTNDVFNLKLPAEMIVLSGCRTGLGKEIRGEGLIGLTRAFMYAGAKRVAVSLWDVNDEATAELMKNLYREMLGKSKLSPSAALRFTQIEMLRGKRWQNPYYWSAFALHGEPK
jgi:CHAT domain-containing protein/lipopolysaccharide biosynthesis regulator YciM